MVEEARRQSSARRATFRNLHRQGHAEIPAPASGILQEIKVTEGTTVNVNTIVGTIAADGEAAAKPTAAAPAPEKPAAEKKEEKKAAPTPPASTPAPVAAAPDADEEARSSPLVRKIAREHGISLSQISGSGLGGRITKQDIQSFIDNQSSVPVASTPPPAVATPAPRPAAPAPFPGDLVPMTKMRQLI